MKNDPQKWPFKLSEAEIKKAVQLNSEREKVLARLGKLDAAYLNSLVQTTLPTLPRQFGQ